MNAFELIILPIIQRLGLIILLSRLYSTPDRYATFIFWLDI
ncbi:hypothetical protein E2C01_071825 [Portunus trituberculatus]|uniref:Uncharacterized protein n=1 Tax=Portunus trituberculatus TaxID=210409 RepID=A0A5B7I4X9_PORTR|nr:hypothetical protein [Portunus trituberculatus]